MNDVKVKKDKAIEEIILKFEDGSERIIKKGAVMEIKEIEGKEFKLEMNFANLSGKEFSKFIYAMAELVAKMLG